MGLRIQNNVEAFNAHRQLSTTSSQASKSMEKLSSGFRINRAADDAAGLAISEKMRGQIGGLAQAQRNAQDGISLVQTAEGSLSEVHAMLQRVRDLKVQHSNGTLSADDQSAIESEIGQIGSEIKSIVDNTKFNGTKLLDNATGFKFQVGANDGETISTGAVSLSAAVGSAGTGGLSELMAISDGASAKTALSSGALSTIAGIDNAVKNVSTVRGNLGAIQNRLENRLNNLASYQENLTASESRIRDVDMAAEMTKFTKLGILQQAGTSMLAQANQSSQNVLKLLG
ncbi:flagellin [Solirubrobacter taibaiensis]|nr:flagellin [Solirubrobacter taibaiensis]